MSKAFNGIVTPEFLESKPDWAPRPREGGGCTVRAQGCEDSDMAYESAIPFSVSVGERRALHTSASDHSIVGSSDALKCVMYRIDQVTTTSATVLLLGETGTGKRLMCVARSSIRSTSFSAKRAPFRMPSRP
jgi:transcriptional regulator with AAA-type ATPase domain